MAQPAQTRQTSPVPTAALWLIPVTAAAFLVRTIAIAGLRRRHPDAAEAVDRWWVWAPLVVVLVLLIVVLAVVTWNVPALGIALTVAFCFAIYRGLFSASSIGSPFRPRR